MIFEDYRAANGAVHELCVLAPGRGTITWNTDHYWVTEVQHCIQLGTDVVHLRLRDDQEGDDDE